MKAIQLYYPPEWAHCYGCGYLNPMGLHIKTFWHKEKGESETRFTPSPHHTAIPGFVYGGLLASLVDCHSTATAAAAKAEAEGLSLEDHPFTLRHRQPQGGLPEAYPLGTGTSPGGAGQGGQGQKGGGGDRALRRGHPHGAGRGGFGPDHRGLCQALSASRERIRAPRGSALGEAMRTSSSQACSRISLTSSRPSPPQAWPRAAACQHLLEAAVLLLHPLQVPPQAEGLHLGVDQLALELGDLAVLRLYLGPKGGHAALQLIVPVEHGSILGSPLGRRCDVRT
jgi:hypothetical protein